jgi:hypothetical protein
VDRTDTTLNLTTTTGLTTDTLYYLGGEAVSFSAFPSGTTATVERGELSLYGGMYHTADQGLGPILTQTLPSPIGQLVEFGYVDGSAPLFTGRIREINLTDGLYIDISAVAVSSIAREIKFEPPQGEIGPAFAISISPSDSQVLAWGGVFVDSGKYGSDSAWTGASDGFVHFVHEDGRFATFKHSGFSTTGDPDSLSIDLDTGNSLVMVGDRNGLVYLNYISHARFRRNRGRIRNIGFRTVRQGAYEFAKDMFDTQNKKLRFEIAVSGEDLKECLERVLSSPYINVAGLSANIPSELVNISIESRASEIRNTLSSSQTEAFILPPTDADRTAAGVWRQRRDTILNTLKDTLNVFSMSLASRTDGELSLVDWTTYRSDVLSFASTDLADTASRFTVEENKSAPIIALVPPNPNFVNESSGDILYDIHVDTQLIKSPRPVTSAQIRAAEVIETKYAIGDVATMEGVARTMTETRVDKFGIPRPEIVFSVQSSTNVEPGGAFTLTHPDMPGPSGTRGMSNAVCLALEVSKDSGSGVTTIKALVIDQEATQRAKWAPAGVVVSALGSAVGIEANVFTDSDAGVGPATDAEAFELDLPSEAQLLDSTGAFRIACEISSRSGNVLTVIDLKGVVPAAGDIITLAAWNTTSGEWASFTDPPAYGADIADTLGTTNDDGQLYS